MPITPRRPIMWTTWKLDHLGLGTVALGASYCFLGLRASPGERAPRGVFKAGQGPSALCRFPLIFLTCGSEGTHLWDQGFPEGSTSSAPN